MIYALFAYRSSKDEYARGVRTAFLMTSSLEDAEELAQDTFVAALAKSRQGSIEEYAEVWLHGGTVSFSAVAPETGMDDP
jgi:DNA-directed RNA polymerase specialized sigma24 family protein